jgi:hypothetical protein
VAFTVTVTGADGKATRVEHPDADNVAVEDGHLVLRVNRAIVGIYAPGRWQSVVEDRTSASRGRRVALPGIPA